MRPVLNLGVDIPIVLVFIVLARELFSVLMALLWKFVKSRFGAPS